MHPMTIRWARTQGQQDHYKRRPGWWLGWAEQTGRRERYGEVGWRMLVLAYEGGYGASVERAARRAQGAK